MSEIQLVNVDGSIPETNPELLDEELPMQDTPPLKRGRGRPPGAKNRVKAAPEPEESEESEQEPAKPAPKKRPKKHVVMEESSSEEEPPPRRILKTPPPLPQDSPRTIRHKAMQSSQKQRTDRHAGRVQGDSSILNDMLSY